MARSFGEYLRKLRMDSGLTLREFARKTNRDAGNISKEERGRLKPPEEDIVQLYVEVLGLSPESDEARQLRALAQVGRGQIPPEVLEDEAVVDKLPVLFRTLAGDEPSEAQLKALIDLLKRH